ncbi:MFS transporter [Corynebacterium timonense]|nr:MFS transporter [Corynebacterium timonense]
MRSSRRVAAAAGGAFASFYIFYTSAPTSLAASTPSAELRVGIVMLIVVVVQPFVPLLSRYASTRGRIVKAALAAMGAGSLALPAAGHWLGMALLGLGFGVFVVASTAWAKETARPELQGTALGVYGFGATIGGAVGAPIGLWLAQSVGVLGTAVAGGILAFGSVFAAPPTQTVPETPGGVTLSEDPESTKLGFQSGTTLVALSGNLLAVTVYASALTSLSSGGTSLPSWLLVLATLGIQVSLAFGRLTGGWATNTWAPFHIGAPMLALLVGAAAAFASFTAPWQKLAFSIVVGITSGAIQTIALTILMNRAGTTAAISRASAAWNMCFDIGLGLGALATIWTDFSA